MVVRGLTRHESYEAIFSTARHASLLPWWQGKQNTKVPSSKDALKKTFFLKHAHMIDKPTIARVKAQADIVEVIGERVALAPSGGGFKGLCPFHAEKTPSFTVSPAKSMYHCFGCGQGGSVIDFVMTSMGWNFAEALTHLAQRYGVDLPNQKKADSPFWQASKALEMALGYYQQLLLNSPQAKGVRHYLEQRGFALKDWEAFELGYALDGWSGLLDEAKHQRIGQKACIDAGLARINQRGTAYDFLRHRVIFPIFSHLKHPIAFAGRALEKNPQAKYLNTPDTQHYRKSEVLFGLPQAMEALRKSKQALIVEGYLDVLRMHQRGFDTALATCGTALTPKHIHLLKRWVNKVVLMFDGDVAGVKAALHCGGFLLDAGLAARVAVLPQGQDPDDFLRQHTPSEMQAVLQAAQPLLEWTIHSLLQQNGNSLEGKQHAWQALVPMLQRVQNLVIRDGAIQHAAEYLGLRAEVLVEQLGKTPMAVQVRTHRPLQPSSQRPEVFDHANTPQREAQNPWQKKSDAEGTALCLLLQCRELLPFASQNLDPEALLFKPYQVLYGKMLQIEDADFAEMDEEILLEKLGSAAPQARALLMDWRIATGVKAIQHPKAAFKQSLYQIQKNAHVHAIRQATRQILTLEKDENALNAYLREKRAISQKNHALRPPNPSRPG